MRTPIIAMVALAACASARGADSEGSGTPDARRAGDPDAVRATGIDAAPGPCGGGPFVDVATWPAGTTAYQAELSWNGTAYAEVFQATGQTTVPKVDLAFVDANGVASAAQQVSPADSAIDDVPMIAWSGTEYGIVYSSSRSTGTDDQQIEMVRADANGNLIAGSRIVVSSLAGTNQGAAIAWDPVDHVWGIQWIQFVDYATNVRFARVGATGAKIAGSDLQLNNDGIGGISSFGQTRLIWTGSRFAVAWLHDYPTNDIHVTEITGAGAAATAATIPLVPGADAFNVALVADGHGYGVAWIQQFGADPTGAHFARTDEHGFVAGSDVALQLSPQTIFGYSTSIAWTGREYGVAWSEAAPGQSTLETIWMSRLDAGGAVIPGATEALTCDRGRNTTPAIATDGTTYAIAYVHDLDDSDAAGHTLIVPAGGP